MKPLPSMPMVTPACAALAPAMPMSVAVATVATLVMRCIFFLTSLLLRWSGAPGCPPATGYSKVRYRSVKEDPTECYDCVKSNVCDNLPDMARPYGDPVEIVTGPIPAQSPFIPAGAKIVVGAVAPASPDPIPIVLLPGFEYRLREWRHPETHELHWLLERRKANRLDRDDE